MEWTPDSAAFRRGFVSRPSRSLPTGIFPIGKGIHVSRSPPASRTDTHEHRNARRAPRFLAAKPVPGGGQAGSPAMHPSRRVPVSTPVACTRPPLVLVKETPRFSCPSRKFHQQPFSGWSGCRRTCSVPCHHRDGGREGLRTATVANGVFPSRSLFGDYSLSSQRARRNPRR